MKRLARSLEKKLSLGVATGLIAFAIVAGLATAVLVYYYQLQESRNLQSQLIETVRAQAEVAVFANNEDIAHGVIKGLLANPMLLAVRIESPSGFRVSSGPDSGGPATEYPLFSPVDHDVQVGQIGVVANEDQLSKKAMTSTLLLLAVVTLQVMLAAALIVWVSRRVVIRPITALASQLAEAKPGSGIHVEFEDSHTEDEIGQLSRNINTLIDAHEQVLSELRDLATIDALTGVFNRRYFLDRMNEELARVQRLESQQAAILMLDIDHFKVINDTWGHAAGDSALQQLGTILRSNARKIDTVGRLGGEEFAILLIGTSPAESESYAGRLRQMVADTPVAHEGKLIQMEVSIGVSAVYVTDANATVALARADRALYIAKQQGRNRVVMADVSTSIEN